MDFATKLKEARKAAGMTQEQLASTLSVSRQAVTKWESGKGLPDIENLRLIASALGVSIDYLLDDGGALDMSVIREPIELSSYSNSHIECKKRYPKRARLSDQAVLARFPSAEIYCLVHKQILDKKERRLQTALWLTTLFANTVDLVNSVKHSDKQFYLVNDDDKQHLVMVTNEFMEIRQLANRLNEKRFDLGEFRFIRGIKLR